MQKIISLLGVSFLLFACSRDPEEKGTVYMPDMAFSPGYRAFSASDITPDGSSMMVPVEGTIARGQMPYRYGISEAEAIRAGVELTDPYPKTTETLARGREVFSQFCVICHGKTAQGDGILTLRKFPSPPSFTSPRVMDFPEGRIFHVITKGFQGMPSHGSQVFERDRWYIAQYIKELQQNK